MDVGWNGQILWFHSRDSLQIVLTMRFSKPSHPTPILSLFTPVIGSTPTSPTLLPGYVKSFVNDSRTGTSPHLTHDPMDVLSCCNKSV